MFNQLAELLKSSSALTMMVALNKDNTLTVTVLPKAKQTGEGANALSTPLSLVGTPDELDAGFVDALSSYVGSRESLITQLENTTAILDAAKKESQGKATAAISKASKAPAPAPSKPAVATSGDETDDEIEEGTEEETDDAGDTENTGSKGGDVTSTTKQPEPAPAGLGDLWS